MKRPFANKRPIGPFAVIDRDRLNNSFPEKNPCEVVKQFKPHLAEMVTATRFHDAEHGTLFFKEDGVWDHTDFIQGEATSVSHEIFATLFEDIIDNAEAVYTAHSHPEDGPGEPSNLSFGDIGNIVSDDSKQTMSVTQVSPNEIVLHGMWQVDQISDSKRDEYGKLFNELFMQQGENPDVVFEMLEFLEPEIMNCRTTVTYDENIQDLVNIGVSIESFET